MKIATLKNKLTKLGVAFTVTIENEFNSDINFNINGVDFKAGVYSKSDEVQDFCREICFCPTSQETERRFFSNFNSLVRYAKAA